MRRVVNLAGKKRGFCMLIDFHTHIFPDKIAKAALSELSMRSGCKPHSDGTLLGLIDSMKAGGIDLSVVLPVVTSPKQFESINRFAAEINGKNGIISFGGIHPDCDCIEEKLDYIKALGLRGIKIHPDYQNTFIDDEKYVRIISHCIKIGLLTVTHSGIDIGFPDTVHCTPAGILKLLSRLPKTDSPCLILAHTGAFGIWDEVEDMLVGKNIFLDISYSLDKIGEAQLMRIIKGHGADKILFATDSPWASQSEYASLLGKLPLSAEELDMISFKNAARLLSL